jgi:hypothetical protein
MAAPSNEATGRGGAKLFRGSRFWRWNVTGATISGLGGGLLFIVIGAELLRATAGNRQAAILGAALVACAVGSLASLFPGNLIATFPTAVRVEAGRGLVLIAPLTRIPIAFEEIRDIRSALTQQGYVVRLKRRHRLLGRFVIHSFFGRDRELLAQAIRRAIEREAG